MRRRSPLAVVTTVVLLLGAACSGGSPGRTGGTGGDGRKGPPVDESKPPLQPDWPLGGVWLASEVDGSGAIIDPRLVFTTEDVQVTAVVALGADVPEGATLLVHWFRVGLEERSFLFTHDIPVGPRGLAFSRGSAPPGLAPGSYEVVAILGEHQTRTPWVVRVAEARFTAISMERSHFAQGPPEPEEWQAPEPDDYDWTGERGTPLGPEPPPGPCASPSIISSFTPLTSVYASISWAGICNTLTISAAVSGPPVTLLSADVSQNEVPGQSTRNVEVCDLPGGSDMPGTVVHFEAAMSDGPSTTDDLVLRDAGQAVIADVRSSPSPSSRVRAGETIGLQAIGTQFAPALGIESLKLLAGRQEIGAVGNLSASTEPIPCDEGRFYAELVTDYTVPDPPPAVIEICALATTFDGHEGRGCIEFYTGEVWKGTYSGTLTFDCNVLGIRSGTVEGDLTIAVGTDGTATMDVVQTLTGVSCGPDAGPVTSPRFTLATGRKTPTGFEFPSFGGAGTLTIAVSDDRGTGAFTARGPSPYWGLTTVEIDLTFEVRRA